LDSRSLVYHIHTISFQPFNTDVCFSCAERSDYEDDLLIH
jgi:hypothetical protein